MEYGDYTSQTWVLKSYARRQCNLAEKVKTYAFSVEKEVDIDICQHRQRFNLRLAKGLMNLYETNEKVHYLKRLLERIGELLAREFRR